jgi:DnaJ-class molecular chaperone
MGLGACVTGGAVKAVYRRLALERHPDVAGAAGDDFIRLQNAYAMLSDLDAHARNDRDVVA